MPEDMDQLENTDMKGRSLEVDSEERADDEQPEQAEPKLLSVNVLDLLPTAGPTGSCDYTSAPNRSWNMVSRSFRSSWRQKQSHC